MNDRQSWRSIISKLTSFKINKGIHSFVNPYSMLKLDGNESIASGIDYWYIDGISLVNKINAELGLDVTRYSFDNTSLAPVVFKYARENNWKIAIIGTKEDLIAKAVDNISNLFNISVSYYRNGYFTSKEDRNNCLNFLKEENFDLVLVGMGTPYQEEFLMDLKALGWNEHGFTCGGYLHQIAKKDDYYPYFFDKYNIRWIYRIMDEPKLIKRYGIEYPLFFIKFRKFLTSFSYHNTKS